jgi:hypothetical protein
VLVDPAIVPLVGTFLSALASTTLGTVELATAVGALANSVTQGLMIGFGDESHYSWGSMLESSLASGLGAGIMPLPNFASSMALGDTLKAAMTSLLEQAGSTVFEALMAVRIGLTKAFNLRTVISQLVAKIAESGIADELNLRNQPGQPPNASQAMEKSAINAVVHASTSALIRQQANSNYLAALVPQAIGVELGIGLGMKLGQAAKGETNFTLSQANSNRDAVEDSDGLSLGDDQASAFNPFLAPIAHPHSGHTLLTAESTEANEWPLDTSKGKMSAKPAGPESLAQNNQPTPAQTTTNMRKVKASNNPYGFFNQNPSNGHPNIQPGFLPGYAINPTTGQAYVKTKNGLQAINDQGAEEVAPEMYVLSAGDAIEATKLGLSAGKVGIHLLGDLAESTLPAVKKGSAALAKKFGMWDEARDAAVPQLQSVKRVSSNVANAPFISEKAAAEGWYPPYPADISIRKVTTASETHFIRFFTGDEPQGWFLVRAKEVASIIDNPEAIRAYLGLKDVPINMADVDVPTNTEMYVGRIGAQPSFGLMKNSGFQYQLLGRIPLNNFKNPRPIVSLNNTNISKLNF